MQNKGFVQVLAALLLLVCFFYLSFSFVTNHYNKTATAFATKPGTNQVDSAVYKRYIDSIAPTKVWFGYTYKECLDKEINLGLDLRGGMNVREKWPTSKRPLRWHSLQSTRPLKTTPTA